MNRAVASGGHSADLHASPWESGGRRGPIHEASCPHTNRPRWAHDLTVEGFPVEVGLCTPCYRVWLAHFPVRLATGGQIRRERQDPYRVGL